MVRSICTGKLESWRNLTNPCLQNPRWLLHTSTLSVSCTHTVYYYYCTPFICGHVAKVLVSAKYGIMHWLTVARTCTANWWYWFSDWSWNMVNSGVTSFPALIPDFQGKWNEASLSCSLLPLLLEMFIL